MQSVSKPKSEIKSTESKGLKRDKVITLLKEGKSYEEIVEDTGISYNYISVIANRNNLNVRARKAKNALTDIENIVQEKREFQTHEIEMICRSSEKDDSEFASQLRCSISEIREIRQKESL